MKLPRPRLIVCRQLTPKPAIAADTQPVEKLLKKLRAIDKVMESINLMTARLAIASDLATQLYKRLETRSSEAVKLWNARRPEHILRCRNADVEHGCQRYTINRQGVCDACNTR